MEHNRPIPLRGSNDSVGSTAAVWLGRVQPGFRCIAADGVKVAYLRMEGMGECGVVAPPATIANAVRDALAAIGAEFNETPITLQRVLAAIKGRARTRRSPKAGPHSGAEWFGLAASMRVCLGLASRS